MAGLCVAPAVLLVALLLQALPLHAGARAPQYRRRAAEVGSRSVQPQTTLRGACRALLRRKGTNTERTVSVRASGDALAHTPALRCCAAALHPHVGCVEACCYAAYWDSTPGNVGDAKDVYTVRTAQR